MVLRYAPLFLTCLAGVVVLGGAQETEPAPSKLLQIPLKRHAVSHHPDHRATRLLRQQERIRRRLVQENVRDNASALSNETVGGIVYNEVPLGVGFGTHYAELYLGIPTQKASVIVDTGSHLTALPCSTCEACGTHTDPLFDVSKSSTAKYLKCHEYNSCTSCNQDKCYISQSYTEGSMWSAVVIDDLVWLGGLNDKHPERILKHYGVRFPVGCQTKETGLFITQKENGIMGFGQDKATLLSYMVAQKRIEHNVFSMCFSPTGGGLVLGGVDYSHHRTQVAYTPMQKDYTGWYPVKVKDILVGDKTLGVDSSQLNSGRGVIVDSGTTDTFFVSSAARAFKKIYSNVAKTDYSEDRMLLSADELAKLPNITIVLQGADGEEDIELEIPPTKYLTKADDGSYYGNFHFSERSGGVLGASTMVGYDVIFDIEKQRVGFAESLCDAIIPKNQGASSPSTPKKITEPAMEESSSNQSDKPANTPATSSPNASISTETSGSTSSSGSGSFFVQILGVTVVGVVAVVAYKRLRKNSWVPLNESETGRGALGRDALDDTEAQPDAMSPTSPPRRNAVSPTSPTISSRRAADSAPAPRFTIGSDSESEHGESPSIVTEL